jgi:phosphatidylglycerophosphatase A
VSGKAVILFLSEGFGSGRSPIAPGTCGSLVGILWFVLLLTTRSLYFYIFGTVSAVFLAIYLCGAAEKIIQIKDPANIVLDEIVAVPVCYSGWLFLVSAAEIPPPAYFFSQKKLLAFVGIFITFRLFDALKPFPIAAIQRLPGGLGIVADDVVAAIFTAIVWVFILKQFSNWFTIYLS